MPNQTIEDGGYQASPYDGANLGAYSRNHEVKYDQVSVLSWWVTNRIKEVQTLFVFPGLFWAARLKTVCTAGFSFMPGKWFIIISIGMRFSLRIPHHSTDHENRSAPVEQIQEQRDQFLPGSRSGTF
ncbi:MAG: hypothetical protein IPJ06_19960 [Saprospiraceae bacterium]|nr:hypothetical protein [Saprospiraceae bacterium]